ncbi:insulin gene enhancer protein ISL-1 [Mytilus galloprovincialis]|uniref:Insulin gene enhancer protein ISL-1 n=1 Tax=Mytilus galloprovincialis TaxID=29158 RepID=A0A8B6GYL6_MYTGA|nr:insulin gene enhancer protein ISL-1 [Mytilus galloprovincialis]
MTADAAAQQPQSIGNTNRKISICVGCGSQIHDQFILKVAPDLEWHASCLKCVDCSQYLDETCTCFVRDGKTYCRKDYARLFGAKCSKCNKACSRNDFVMRAKDNLYHIDCFHCVACRRQLIPGDEFALKDNELFCKEDHEVSDIDMNTALEVEDIKLEAEEHTVKTSENVKEKRENGVHKNKGNKDKTKNGESRRKSDQKPTRGRTVLNEKQLHTLCTWYNANPRPDALMKEQLVEMTNLSPRVIRVWFQNKRCKDNKRSILSKQQQQQQQQQQEKNARFCGPLQGIPMVASSPVKHENHIPMNPIEVQSYQQKWQPFNTYRIKNQMDEAPLQQLMNSFDNMESDNSSSFHPNGTGYSDGYVWNHPDYDSNTQFSDSDYNHESRMSSSPYGREYSIESRMSSSPLSQ